MIGRSLFFSATVLVVGAGAASAAQPHTDVIRVRTNCAGVPAPQCFSGPNALANAIQEVHQPSGGRQLPSDTNHVVVDIGPGTFDLDLGAFTSTVYGYCDGPSASNPITHLTYRGAGKTATVLRGGGYDNGLFNGSNFAMLIRNCDEFAVEDLTLRALDGGTTQLGQPVGVQSGVLFSGDGETYWRRVKIEASAIAWYDTGSSGVAASRHFWWDSNLKVTYANACTSITASTLYGTGVTHTFHHSTLELDEVDGQLGPPGCQNGVGFAVVYLSTGYHVYAFDSTFTYYTFDPTASATNWYLGTIPCFGDESASVVEGAGNTVRVRSPLGNGATANSAVGFRACGGKLELERTTFDLAAVSNKTRILKAGGGALEVRPSYNGSGTTPPLVEATVAGAETFTETDCGSVCSDASPGTQYHLLGYDASCSAGGGPWFDQTGNACRQ
jgi:hypothetical protein